MFEQGRSSSSRGYLVYTALLTQSGTSAPVATVLENTLGGTVVWSYIGVGEYNATLTGAFTSGKTWLFIQTTDNAALAYNVFGILRVSANVIQVTTGSGDPLAADDQILNGTPVEIRVYY